MTIKPRPDPWGHHQKAWRPGSHSVLTARPGLRLAATVLDRVVTRIYFADQPAANTDDPAVARVPETRRSTLLAEPTNSRYNFDIKLQGPNETVLFAV